MGRYFRLQLQFPVQQSVLALARRRPVLTDEIVRAYPASSDTAQLQRCLVGVWIPTTDAVGCQSMTGPATGFVPSRLPCAIETTRHDVCKLELPPQFAVFDMQIVMENSPHGTIAHGLVRVDLFQ